MTSPHRLTSASSSALELIVLHILVALPPVIRLHLEIDPSAIFWGISLVIVNSVKRTFAISCGFVISRFHRPFVKRDKRRFPFVANRYAPCAIRLITSNVWVVTSVFHVAPNAIYSAIRFPVFDFRFFSALSTHAPTAYNCSRFQVFPAYYFCRATITAAQPPCRYTSIVNKIFCSL